MALYNTNFACAKEIKAHKEAKKQVIELRKELKDYTGSSLPAQSIPSTNPLEGTFESARELAELRERLQQALELQASTRIALKQCEEKTKEWNKEAAEKEKKEKANKPIKQKDESKKTSTQKTEGKKDKDEQYVSQRCLKPRVSKSHLGELCQCRLGKDGVCQYHG
jgi:hypothetical protein